MCSCGVSVCWCVVFEIMKIKVFECHNTIHEHIKVVCNDMVWMSGAIWMACMWIVVCEWWMQHNQCVGAQWVWCGVVWLKQNCNQCCGCVIIYEYVIGCVDDI